MMADKEMLASVIRNLFTNAIKFSHKQGKIALTSVGDEKYSTLSVVDFGIGMEDQKVVLINSAGPHSVKSSRGTGQEKGNGLGLILCKSFVTMMNGEMKAESKLQKGTVFTIQLPAAESV